MSETRTMLNLLSEERIFRISRDGDDHFIIIEACDDYFRERLTRNQLRQLGREIMELANV